MIVVVVVVVALDASWWSRESRKMMLLSWRRYLLVDEHVCDEAFRSGGDSRGSSVELIASDQYV